MATTDPPIQARIALLPLELLAPRAVHAPRALSHAPAVLESPSRKSSAQSPSAPLHYAPLSDLGGSSRYTASSCDDRTHRTTDRAGAPRDPRARRAIWFG